MKKWTRNQFHKLLKTEKINYISSFKHYGSEYGGWSIIPDKITNESIVFSFGIGDDISFDKGLIDSFGLDVFAFDPTPKSIDWIRKLERIRGFKPYNYGLGARNGLVPFLPPKRDDFISFKHISSIKEISTENILLAPVKTISTIMSELNIAYIDILKLDIEGFEYDVIDDIININRNIGQLLIEFHHHYKGFHFLQTLDSIRKLKNAGFKLFYKSKTGFEFSFINRVLC